MLVVQFHSKANMLIIQFQSTNICFYLFKKTLHKNMTKNLIPKCGKKAYKIL